MSASSCPDDAEHSRRLNEILAAYLQQLDAGHAPDEEALVAAHPEFAEELRAFLEDMRLLQQAAGTPGSSAAQPAQDAHPLSQNPYAPSAENESRAAPLAAPRTPDEPPETRKVRYFGEYELLEEIARGGMGIVYRARQTSLKRVVALKMILAGQFANEDEVRRFYGEAQAAARLEHPHIVPIFEIGQHEGQHYFTMALVEGENLARHVARGVFAPLRAAEIMAKVARAIAFAHAEGVVHRDLKPANILLDVRGEPHITDFGLAKRVAATADETTTGPATASGQVLGTPSFMPPEQAAGRNADVGPLSDVYSLGAVLYCLLAGRPPFQAASPLDTLLQVLDAEPVPPRRLNPLVPRDLNTICMTCLAKEPNRRYASAAALADGLERFLRDEPILARPPGPAERLLRLARKHRRAATLVAAIAAATLLLSAAAWGGWRFWQSARQGWLAIKCDLPQTAELLDEHDRPLLPPFALPTEAPVLVPQGEHRLRLTAPGQLSETWLVGINPGLNEFTLGPSDRWLWRPVGTEPQSCFGFLKLPDRTDLVVLERRFGRLSMRRLDGRTATAVWETPLDVRSPPQAASDQVPAASWQSVLDCLSADLAEHPPSLLEPPPDLDADGDPDVLWLSGQADLLAASGKTGNVLWWQDACPGGRFEGQPVPCELPGEDGPALLVAGNRTPAPWRRGGRVRPTEQ